MKYKLNKTNKTTHDGKALFQIEATCNFGSIIKDTLGGYIEAVENLNQDDNSWVSDNAQVFGDAWVSDDAWVFGNAQVSAMKQ